MRRSFIYSCKWAMFHFESSISSQWVKKRIESHILSGQRSRLESSWKCVCVRRCFPNCGHHTINRPGCVSERETAEMRQLLLSWCRESLSCCSIYTCVSLLLHTLPHTSVKPLSTFFKLTEIGELRDPNWTRRLIISEFCPHYDLSQIFTVGPDF